MRNLIKMSEKKCRKQLRVMFNRQTPIDPSASIFISAVLQFLCKDILTKAEILRAEKGSKSIKPFHLQKAIKGDPELDLLLKSMIEYV